MQLVRPRGGPGARWGAGRDASRAQPLAGLGRTGRGPTREGGGTDGVVLTTFHRAKGLQWPTALVLGLSDGLMPIASAQTPAAVDEERRLLYVALTRAEEELWCSWFAREAGPGRGGAPGGMRHAPSPWLASVERAIAQLEKEAAPTAATEVSARVAELRARLAAATEATDVAAAEGPGEGST